MASLFVLIIAGFGCVQSATHFYRQPRYTIPPPSIRAFQPEGLKVSIPHTDGIQSFAFHANINKPLDWRDEGAVNLAAAEREGDEWVVANSTVKLQAGDVLHYVVYVVKDNLGYRLQDKSYEITELYCGDDWTRPATVTSPVTTTTAAAPVVGSHEASHRICVRLVLNLTQSLFDSQQEIDSLKETISILRDMLEKKSEESRTLTLEGVGQEDNHLQLIVPAIIQDKLRLPLSVSNVRRAPRGLVKFEVESIDDKVAVVKAAKERLKHSRFSIAY